MKAERVSISDSVNRGTSTARGTRKPVQLVVYKRGSKAREREGEEREHCSRLYTILPSRNRNLLSRDGNLGQITGKLLVP
jgi:hypothetical protein